MRTTNELATIREQLQAFKNLSVDLRDSGKSAFLYIRSATRAAEISIDPEGLFFVEYWDIADELSDRAPAKSETVQSSPDAVKRLVEWLKCHG